MYFFYMLRCADGSIYVGSTSDVARRVATHNVGRGASFTAMRRPVVLIYSEAHSTSQLAIARERQVKRWTRAKKEALAAGDLQLLRTL